MAKNAFPYGIKSPAEFPTVADQVLTEYFTICAGLGVQGAVILGCALGLYRDGAYLVGDNDIDVAAITDDLGRAFLTRRLIEHGYLQGRTFGANNTHFFNFNLDVPILLDVFWRRPEGYYAELAAVEYKGASYPIPSPTDEYFERCYGENWRVNDPDNEGSKFTG